jgi:outer membrane protein OmpA-like peptidoglycan-associated protein
MSRSFDTDVARENGLPVDAEPTERLKQALIGATHDKSAFDAVMRDVDALREDAPKYLIRTLMNFAAEEDLQAEAQTDDLPVQLVALLRQPDGAPVRAVRVTISAAKTDAGKIAPREVRIAKTLSDGSFILRMPFEWRRAKPKEIEITVSGANGSTVVKIPLASLGQDGNVGPITLDRHLIPAPLSLFAGLNAIAEADSADKPMQQENLTHAVELGDDDCGLVFRTDPSQDRFPYSALFRLTDPHLSIPTLVGLKKDARPRGEDGSRPLNAIFPDDLTGGQPALVEFHAAERVAIERPVAMDAFKRVITGANTPRVLPIAASLSIGYVVNMAQRWTQKGLALGDLVYSLPLAPGEQQRIAVVERTQTQSVMEREALEQREDLRFDETDSSSVHATFAAAFHESAQGGSAYDASSSSFSIAAAAGGGGVWPFGAAAGGVATSYGTASSAGSTSTWMDGARQSTSRAAQSTQASVSRRASANRSSSRAAMRLATSSERSSVTTKVITNHNKAHALTMQYWEVLRLFDVQTVVEDVSLVCMVPLDIIDFLPDGEPATLGANAINRTALLHRYARLLEHSDVLMRTVPWRLRRGLQALVDFVADPRSEVQTPTGSALNIISISVSAPSTVVDELRVHLMLKNGMRTGSTKLLGTLTPLPSGQNALASEIALFNTLRSQRDVQASSKVLTAQIPLPASTGLQDIVAAVITHSTKRLDYTFASEEVAQAISLFTGNPVQLAAALAGAIQKTTFSRSYDQSRIGAELGELEVRSVTADIKPSVTPPVQARTLVTGDWNNGIPIGDAGLTVAATRLAPELSYDSLLEIERALQWVMRNTMACTIRVAAALTAEERTVMLERFSITPPTLDANGTVHEGVPLLSCITNNILGFYGNSMVMPFQIPLSLAENVKLDTGKLQRALKRFHTNGFDHPASTVALPTKGVLGEAVLGRCPSAEKIDLTRFWNWQDSPGDAATDISPVSVPSGNALSGVEAPSKLTGLSPIINNFSTQGPTADTSLATAIAGKAIELSKPFDIGALTNAASLATIGAKTLDTAESARKDALASATQLAAKAMETAAALKGAKTSGSDSKGDKAPDAGGNSGSNSDSNGGSSTAGDGPGGNGGQPDPAPPSGTAPTPPTPKPAALHLFFNLDKTDFVETTNEGRGGQQARLDAWIAATKAAKATAVTVRGFASPEGTNQRNAELVKKRAETLQALLQSALGNGVRVVAGVGGILQTGDNAQFPELRRADAEITAP